MTEVVERLKERVARIVDPDEWLAIDRARSAFDLPRDLTPERLCKGSLGKADEIHALYASLILSLQGEVEKAKADAELCAAEWTKEIEHGNALRARLQAALAALEPFALTKPSSFYDADGSECEGYSIHLTGTGKPDFTGADLASARQALQKQTRDANAKATDSGMTLKSAIGWQPIDSAPKDGTAILVACSKQDGRSIVGEAFWDPGTEAWMWANEDPWQDDAILMMWEVTHWQPLPEPPPADGALGAPIAERGQGNGNSPNSPARQALSPTGGG